MILGGLRKNGPKPAIRWFPLTRVPATASTKHRGGCCRCAIRRRTSPDRCRRPTWLITSRPCHRSRQFPPNNRRARIQPIRRCRDRPSCRRQCKRVRAVRPPRLRPPPNRRIRMDKLRRAACRQPCPRFPCSRRSRRNRPTSCSRRSPRPRRRRIRPGCEARIRGACPSMDSSARPCSNLRPKRKRKSGFSRSSEGAGSTLTPCPPLFRLSALSLAHRFGLVSQLLTRSVSEGNATRGSSCAGAYFRSRRWISSTMFLIGNRS